MTDVHADPLDRLRLRTSEKWTAYPADVLPLFVAEMDYPLAAPIADILISRVRASDTGYVGSPGPLAPAFAGFAERRWGWTVDAANVRTTTDVSVAIVESLRLAIEPGDAVVITPPVYPPFFDLVREARGVVAGVPLLDDGVSWALDLPGIERAFASGARAMVLCNPHNPLGHVHPLDQLRRLAELAETYNVTVISDEIHGALTHPGADFVPFLTVSDSAREQGVCITSASKAWNLAGLKCAVMVTAHERMHELLRQLPEEVGFRTSLLGLHASVAAFADSEGWLDGVVTAITANRDQLGTLLSEHLPAVGCRPPQASYLAWLDFRDFGWGDDPAERALEAKVALNSGLSFGAEGRGFARLNFACSLEVLEEAVARLAAG